ncbi:MAG: peptidylprolyl isomerase [Planctomycetota bacterium]
MKYFAFLSLVGGLVFSAVAAGAPPYTPSQTTPKVVIETIVGDITIELFPGQAPITVDNFLQYVNSSFYGGLIIHRITKNPTFKIVQGGGYQPGGFPRTEGLRPPIINESHNGRSNLRGTIAMARTSDPNSATSQFYINVTDNTSLDLGDGYCVFGQVISGMDIIDQIQQLPILNPWYEGGILFNECPYYDIYWVYVFRQQVRACVSPSGNDTTGVGSPDAPFKTIQKAIDTINEPGHVVPAPATYTGAGNVDLDFKGKAITVRAIEPRDANTVTKTVIDCQGSSTGQHRAFYFYSNEDADSVVKGLTITNGYQALGGAIFCQNSSPTIQNCNIINNTASVYGGGIYCYNSDAVISNCTFSDNTALSRGGAIHCNYYSGVTVGNSILWNNTAALGHEIALASSSLPSTITVSYSNIDGGKAEVYADAGCSAVWGPGNLDIDPRFVDAANGDYHLQSRQGQWEDANGWKQGARTSPCIETGNPGSGIVFEPNDWNLLRIEMGTYGGTTKASIPPEDWGLLADIDNDGTTDNSDFAWFASYWLDEGSELPADLDRSKNVDIADLQLFSNDWLQPAVAIIANKADFNGDGTINIRDFAILASEWQEQGIDKTSDLNNDAIINIYDLYWFAKVWLH